MPNPLDVELELLIYRARSNIGRVRDQIAKLRKTHEQLIGQPRGTATAPDGSTTWLVATEEQVDWLFNPPVADCDAQRALLDKAVEDWRARVSDGGDCLRACYSAMLSAIVSLWRLCWDELRTPDKGDLALSPSDWFGPLGCRLDLIRAEIADERNAIVAKGSSPAELAKMELVWSERLHRGFVEVATQVRALKDVRVALRRRWASELWRWSDLVRARHDDAWSPPILTRSAMSLADRIRDDVRAVFSDADSIPGVPRFELYGTWVNVERISPLQTNCQEYDWCRARPFADIQLAGDPGTLSLDAAIDLVPVDKLAPQSPGDTSEPAKLRDDFKQSKADFDRLEKELSIEITDRLNAINLFITHYDGPWGNAMQALSRYLSRQRAMAPDVAKLWQARANLVGWEQIAAAVDEGLMVASVLVPEVAAIWRLPDVGPTGLAAKIAEAKASREAATAAVTARGVERDAARHAMLQAIADAELQRIAQAANARPLASLEPNWGLDPDGVTRPALRLPDAADLRDATTPVRPSVEPAAEPMRPPDPNGWIAGNAYVNIRGAYRDVDEATGVISCKLTGSHRLVDSAFRKYSDAFGKLRAAVEAEKATIVDAALTPAALEARARKQIFDKERAAPYIVNYLNEVLDAPVTSSALWHLDVPDPTAGAVMASIDRSLAASRDRLPQYTALELLALESDWPATPPGTSGLPAPERDHLEDMFAGDPGEALAAAMAYIGSPIRSLVHDGGVIALDQLDKEFMDDNGARLSDMNDDLLSARKELLALADLAASLDPFTPKADHLLEQKRTHGDALADAVTARAGTSIPEELDDVDDLSEQIGAWRQARDARIERDAAEVSEMDGRYLALVRAAYAQSPRFTALAQAIEAALGHKDARFVEHTRPTAVLFAASAMGYLASAKAAVEHALRG